MTLKFKLLLFNFLLLTTSMSFAQSGNVSLSTRVEALQRYATIHPAEKVHLYTTFFR